MHNLSEIAIAQLHELELTETYRTLSQLVGEEVAEESIINKLTGGGYKDDLAVHLRTAARSRNVEKRQDLLIAYYLAAGCGVVRLCRLLNVGQSRVYRVKKELEEGKYDTAPKTFFNTLLRAEPNLVFRLQYIMTFLNVLDGFRILDPAEPRTFLDGQVRQT